MVFDCDGVLVDSEELAWSAWSEVLAQHGVEVSAEDISRLTGRTQADVYRAFCGRGRLPTEEKTLADVACRTVERFRSDLRPFDDAVATVRTLSAQAAPLAVASSSPRWRLDVSLAISGLADAFDVTVAGDEVAQGKPDPALFLTAAERLGVDPVRCVAVEDSPLGVASAAAAGMWVIAVARTDGDCDLLDSAHRVVERLDPDQFWSLCMHADDHR